MSLRLDLRAQLFGSCARSGGKQLGKLVEVDGGEVNTAFSVIDFDDRCG
jgi:hypothetical protein